MIEYTDVIKLTLIGISLVAASFTILHFISDYINLIQSSGRVRILWIAAIILSIVFWFGVPAYEHFKAGRKDDVISEIANTASLLMFFITVYFVVDYAQQIRNEGRMTHNQTFAVITFSLIFVFLLGVSYGLNVKKDKTSLKEIITKDKSNSESTYKEAIIIMILSHHTAFQANGRSIIVPSGDVVRISSIPSP